MSEELDIVEKESDQLFLDLIRARPCLYEKSSDDFSDKGKKDNCWEEIAAITDSTGMHNLQII